MDLQNIQTEEQNIISLERCNQCDQVFYIHDADENDERIVATYDDHRYCNLACMIQNK